MNILLVSPDPWSPFYNSKHGYAISLNLLGHNVYFIQPKYSSRIKVVKSQYSNLSIVETQRPLPLARHLPIKLGRALNRYSIRSLEEVVGANVDLIWNFDSSRYHDLPLTRHYKTIMHFVDHTDIKNTRKLRNSYDLFLSVNHSIKTTLKIKGIRSQVIPHASLNKENIDQRIGEKFTIGYIGNLALKYINWKLVKKLVEDNINIQFEFIGPVHNKHHGKRIDNNAIDFLNNYSNVTLVGPLSYEAAIQRMCTWHAGILFYDESSYPQQISSSHKLLQYFSCGFPIISNRLSEYASLPAEILTTYSTPEDAQRVLKEIMTNYSKYNSKQLRDKRKQIASENSYERKINLILNMINVIN